MHPKTAGEQAGQPTTMTNAPMAAATDGKSRTTAVVHENARRPRIESPVPGHAVEDHSRVVAIDGPAAAGKSTVARSLADRLGAMLFDTGTLYRAVTLSALRHHVPFSKGPELAALAGERHIDVAPPSAPDGRLYDVRLDGEDVTWPIRDQAVEAAVSEVASHPEVREALLPAQRRIAARGPVVMVGRDIGTVVVPDAAVKIYLRASLAERARRRHEELRQRGVEVGFEEVLADLQRRDAIDSGREASPLRIAPDATVIDTDRADVSQVVDRIVQLVSHAWGQPGNNRLRRPPVAPRPGDPPVR